MISFFLVARDWSTLRSFSSQKRMAVVMLWCDKSCKPWRGVFAVLHSIGVLSTYALRFWSCETFIHCIQTLFEQHFCVSTVIYQASDWPTSSLRLNLIQSKYTFYISLNLHNFLSAYFLRGLVCSRPIQNSWHGKQEISALCGIAQRYNDPSYFWKRTFAVLVHVCKSVSKYAGASEQFVDACHTKF